MPDLEVDRNGVLVFNSPKPLSRSASRRNQKQNPRSEDWSAVSPAGSPAGVISSAAENQAQPVKTADITPSWRN
jgi:hypothetical protein